MHGYGRGWFKPRMAHSSGYSYIGPCRCGTGPNAFYQGPNGRIVPARQVYRSGFPTILTKEDLKAELEVLKKEKTELENRIEEIEKQK